MIPRATYRQIQFSLLFCVMTITSFCQIQQPNRFEKERKFTDEDFTIVPLEADGIVLIRERNKYKSGKQLWDIVLLDSALQESGALELEIDAQNKLVGYDHSPGFLYLLFSRKEYKGEMELLSIDVKSKEIISYEIKPELNFQITQFCKAGENFIFGGYVNTESAVLLYALSTKNVKVVPGFFQKNIELVDMRANTNQTFNTVLIDRVDRDNPKLVFKTFDSSGKQLLENSVEIDEEIALQNGISSALEREDLMIIGTWGKRSGKHASGFYTLPVDPFGKQSINRIHFGELEHYLDYLKPKKASAVKARTSKALEAKKIPDFTNSVLPFKIVEHESGFLLLAESYIPSNSSQSNNPQSPYTGYPGPYTGSYPYSPYGLGYYPSNRGYHPVYNYGNNVSNEDNVRIVHGVVLNFDASGKLIWDFSIKLDDIKRSSLEQNVDFHLTKDSVQLFYKRESELILRKMALSTKEISESTEKIKSKDPGDEVRSENRSGGIIKKWFGSNYYVWGYQTIRNRTRSNKTREVFYINKVVVH